MKSIEQHKEDGTYRKDRHESKVDLSGFQVKEVPDCSDLPDKAQEYFKEFALMQIKVDQLTLVDIPALKLLATAYAEYINALDTMEIEGSIIGDDNPKVHPMNTIKKDSREAVYKLLRDFGMTPTSRTRILSSENMPQSVDEDPLVQLMKR